MGKRRQALTLVIMLFLTLLLAVVLTLVSSRKVAAEIFIASQRVIAQQTAEKFRFALELGKPVDRFYGAKELISEMVRNNPDIESAWVVSETGKPLYAYPEYHHSRDEFRFELPIVGENILVVQLTDTDVLELMSHYRNRISLYAFSVFICGALAIILISFSKMGKRISIAVMMLAQLSFGILVAASYRGTYMDSIDHTARSIDNIIMQDVLKIENFGIPRDEFIAFSDYLEEIAQSVGVFDRICAPDELHADKTGNYVSLTESSLCAVLDEKAISDKILGYVLDALILSAVTLFLALEGLRYIEKPKREAKTFSLPTFRFAVFIAYFGLNMCAAFTPILAKKLALDSGFNSDFIIGLPISAEMFAGLAAICVSRIFIRKMGFSASLYCCVIVAACGLIFSALAGNVVTYTAARVLVGIGFALLTMIARVLASSQPDTKTKSDTLSSLVSSSIIGYCSGTVIGGLLAERMTFETVFYIAAAITLLSLPLFASSGMNAVTLQAQKRLNNVVKNIFANKQAVIYLIALVLPCNAAGMFMSYSVPLFGDSIGLTTSFVSALIMLNSLIAAYFSTFSSRLVLKLFGSEKAVVYYALLTAAVLIGFTLAPVLWILIAATLVLGIADSFGMVMLSHNFTEIPSVRRAGASDAMMTVTLSGKAGQFIAPQLFALTLGSPVLTGVIVAAGGIVYRIIGCNKTGHAEGNEV